MICRKAGSLSVVNACATPQGVGRRRCRKLRGLFALLPLGLLLGALTMLGGPARAQDQNAAQSKSAPTQDKNAGGASAQDAQQLLDDIADINTLAVLNPLALKPEQIDKLITTITTAKTDYDKKVTALGASELSKVADEIRAVKQRALTGAPEPEDFKAKINQIGQDFLKKRTQLNAENVTRISSEANDILTPKQIGAAARLFKESGVQAQPGMGQFDNYVRVIFIEYPRIVPLLKEMRSAAGSSAGNPAPGTNASATGAATQRP